MGTLGTLTEFCGLFFKGVKLMCWGSQEEYEGGYGGWLYLYIYDISNIYLKDRSNKGQILN